MHMKYFTSVVFSMFMAGSVSAALLPGAESGNNKILPAGGSSSGKLLSGGGSTNEGASGGGSSSSKMLPPSANNGGKILPAPANTTGGGDFFAAPTNLRLSKGSITDKGNNSNATRELGEPFHGNYIGNPEGKSLWWKYEARTNGLLVVSTAGSTFDTVLAAYVGDSVGSLTMLASDNNSGPGETSVITFKVFQGTIYYIAVDGYNGASGNIKLSAVIVDNSEGSDGRPVNDDYADRLGLAGNYVVDYGTNFNATPEVEDLVDIGIIDDSPSGQTVWWTWTAPMAGRVTFSTFGSDFDTVLYIFRRNSSGALVNFYYHDDVNIRNNRSSLITVQAGRDTYGLPALDVVAGEVFDIAVDGFSDFAGFIALSVNQQPKSTNVANDVFDFRIGIQSNSYTADATTNGATQFEAGEPVHANASTPSTLWWTWTAPGNGTATITAKAREATGPTVAASNLKPVIAAYTGPNVATLKEVGSAVDDNADGDTELSFTTVKGRIYQIAVAGGIVPGNANGLFTFKLDYASGAPVIANQPNSVSLTATKDAVFTVKVTPSTRKPLTYRWERRSGKTWVKLSNGTTYSGAATASLTVKNTTTAMNGQQFRCIITNSIGKVTSSTATLSVSAPAKAKKKAPAKKLLSR